MSKSPRKRDRKRRQSGSKLEKPEQAHRPQPGGIAKRWTVLLRALEVAGFLLWVYVIFWQGSYVLALWLGILLGVGIAYLLFGISLKLAGVVVALAAAGILIQPHLPPRVAMRGWLVPANEPTPRNACESIPSGAMLLIAGNSATWSTSFPATVIEIGNDKMLTMNKVGDRIALSGKFFSADGKIVAELKDNEFYINPNNYFRIERPDDHSLVVYDQRDVRVLDVQYMNSHTVRFGGVVRLPPQAVVISKTVGIFSNSMCFGNNQVAFRLGR